jgi:hypothetical protein
VIGRGALSASLIAALALPLAGCGLFGPSVSLPLCAAYYYNVLLPAAFAPAARTLVMPHVEWALATMRATPHLDQLAATTRIQEEMNAIGARNPTPSGRADWPTLLKTMADRYDPACRALAGLPALDVPGIMTAAQP